MVKFARAAFLWVPGLSPGVSGTADAELSYFVSEPDYRLSGCHGQHIRHGPFQCFAREVSREGLAEDAGPR